MTLSARAEGVSEVYKRLTASVVVLAIVATIVPLRAEEEIRILTDVRAEVDAHRRVGALLSVELTDGTLLTGSAGTVRKNEFAISTAPQVKRTIEYSRIHAFVDPETGRTVALVQQTPPPTGRVSSPRLKMAAIIVVAAVASVYIVALVIATHVK
jgi:hypothetical protein